MQLQQSGTVYTQIEIEVSNQSYSNASATAVNRHNPILWTKTMYFMKANMNLKYLDHCLFQYWPNTSNFFTFRENFVFKEQLTRSHQYSASFSNSFESKVYLYRMQRSDRKFYSFFFYEGCRREKYKVFTMEKTNFFNSSKRRREFLHKLFT